MISSAKAKWLIPRELHHLQKLSGLYQGSYILDGSENQPFERPREASERNIPYTQ